MAVSIRLKRTGSKNNSFFRLVAADSRSPRDGRFIEELGWYDPYAKENKVSLKQERINYWLSQGAYISNTIKSFMKKTGAQSK